MLSILPVAMVVSSGDQLTVRTQLVCPFRVCRGVPVSQSHILAVESPLPLTIVEDEEGENMVANIASPWPGIDEEHLDTARTLKTACGVNCRLRESSVVFKPGRIIDRYRSLVMSTAESVGGDFRSRSGR